MVNVIDSRPLYQQVKNRILEMIIERRWPPGTYLPSEAALGTEFEVSKGTVRKALDELTSENRVVRRQGKGTLVPEHTVDRALFHFFHLHERNGGKCLPESKVLSCRRLKANRDLSQELGVERGSSVIGIRRLRYLGGRAILVEDIFLPAALFPDLGRPNPNDLPNTLYHYYEQQYGVTICRAEEELTAVAANEEDAAQLNVPEGTPLLQVERRAMSLDGTVAEIRRSRCLTDGVFYLNRLE